MLEAIRRATSFLRQKQVLHKLGVLISITVIAVACYVLYHMLRGIEQGHIPYRVNALAAFTSYSIGHNVGASVFTGGAVRYRIYSAWGLNAIDVAKICFLAGLTFWLGNAAVLGLGIAYHPEAAASIDQLPAWLNRALAFGIIAALIGYVAWVWAQPRH